MVEMEPIENIVKRDRIAASKRPDLKFPTGNLNIIGKYAYAYSGPITVATSNVVALDFTTTTDIIDGKLQIQWLENGADGSDSYYNLELNGILIAGNLIGTGHGEPRPTMNPENWIPIIIPPYTRCRILFTMLSGGGSIVLGATLTGTVHNA